jgi:hypothetical protein
MDAVYDASIPKPLFVRRSKGLNLNPGSVSTRLSQLAKAGEIKKASRGYTTK